MKTMYTCQGAAPCAPYAMQHGQRRWAWSNRVPPRRSGFHELNLARFDTGYHTKCMFSLFLAPRAVRALSWLLRLAK